MRVGTFASDLTSPIPPCLGFEFADDLTYEQWAAIGSTLRSAEQSLMWRLGDWLLYGENRNWGEKYDRAIEATGYDYGTLRNAKSIAKRFPLSRRRDKLTFAHHQELASLSDDDAERLLDQAEAETWSRNDLRARVAQVKAAASANARKKISHSVLVDSSGRLLADRVICADALTGLNVLPDAIIDMCITSPPYFGLRDYNIAGQIGWEETPELYIERLVEVFREVRRVLRDDGTLWLNIGDSYASFRNGEATPDTARGENSGTFVPKGMAKNRMGSTFAGTGIKHKDLIGIPWRLALALQEDGWYLRSDIIWHKPNPMPESVTDRPTTAHEYVFLLAKSETYFFDAEAIREPSICFGIDARSGKGNIRYEGKRTIDLRANGQDAFVTIKEKRNNRSVWTIRTKPYAGAHFATFPPELVKTPILAGSPPNGLVLDTFMGSGTTAVVAKQLGRHYVGIELNPEYVAMAEQRLANEKD
jgi:DNA modification methylase